MLTNKKILMVIAPRDFRDAEYNEPRKVFEEKEIDVKVTSIKICEAIGTEGTIVPIDFKISDLSIDDFDAVVFVGGPGMVKIIDNKELHELAINFFRVGKLVAAICVAPAILAKAGILKGMRATSWPGVREDLEKNEANYIKEDIVVDENIITASGPLVAKNFGEEIVNNLH
jgi:protease I